MNARPTAPSGDAAGDKAGELAQADTNASMTVRPVDLRDYVEFATDEANRVRVFATPRLAVDLWCIQPRQGTPVLRFADVEVTYTVIAGRSWFVTDDGDVGLDPMGAIMIAPDVVHGIDNRAADPLVVVATSSPPSSEPEAVPVTSTRAAVHPPPTSPGLGRRLVEGILGTRRPSD